MAILIILFTILIPPVLILLRLNGTFGLYIEVDIKNQRIYGWYKGRILESDYFSLDSSIEDIKLKHYKLEAKCKEEIKKLNY